MSEQPTNAFIAKHWDYEKDRKQNMHIIKRVWKEIHEGKEEKRKEEKNVYLIESPPLHPRASPEYPQKQERKHRRIYSHTPAPSPVHHMMGGEASLQELLQDEEDRKRSRALNHWETLRRGVFWQSLHPSYNIGRKV
jgi:hypothetical protein